MRRIFIVGYMGVGKTSIGKKIAALLHLDFIDLDEAIEESTGKTVLQLFEDFGESGFRKIEQDMLHKVVKKTNVVISCGGGTPCFFDNMSFMNDCGETVYLYASIDYIFNSLQQNSINRPLLKNYKGDELYDFIKKQFTEREHFYKKAKKTIDVVTFTVSKSSLL